MIQEFNEVEMRPSGIVYDSVLEQIKRLHLKNPELAGELAISAIELILTGQISSDDLMIDTMLQPMVKMVGANQAKYDSRIEATKNKQIVDYKLEEIAALYSQKLPQKIIGERLGLSQQIVSYRLQMIRTKYPELLQKVQEDLPNVYKNTKNTNGTKTENFVQNSICKELVDSSPNSGTEVKFVF